MYSLKQSVLVTELILGKLGTVRSSSFDIAVTTNTAPLDASALVLASVTMKFSKNV